MCAVWELQGSYECVVLPKHVWNAEVLSETLDTGMTNMDQIAHTPRDGYINTNISESLTGNVTVHKYTKYGACPVLRTPQDITSLLLPPSIVSWSDTSVGTCDFVFVG